MMKIWWEGVGSSVEHVEYTEHTRMEARIANDWLASSSVQRKKCVVKAVKLSPKTAGVTTARSLDA